MEHLVVRNARQHNLKGVSCEIPRGKLVVITGPSGSGKSSLAFDTIYAEGQRRYVESLSAYARQFLEQLAKPDVELITGLSPAIAIEQRALGKSPRSTVGTVTEIADYLRLLFARAGTPHCPSCGARIAAQTVQEIVDRILSRGPGARLSVLAPIAHHRKGELKLELEKLRREGFVRARIDGQVIDLGDELVLDKSRAHDLEVVVDRVVLKDGLAGRVADSVELALKLGSGVLYVLEEGAREPEVLSERFACVACGVSLPPIEPRLFSFNGPHGACPSCGGLGERRVIDPERCVGSPALTLREGVVLGWGRRGSVAYATELGRAVEALGVPPDVPWRDLPEAARGAILDGAPAKKGKRAYVGLVARLSQRLDGDSPDDDGELDDDDADDDAARFAAVRTCVDCGGKRLRKEALAVRLGDRSIAELGALPLGALRDFLRALGDSDELGGQARKVAAPLLAAVIARLGFLLEVGLDYLTLDRGGATLSGGEGQRIRLATQIGAALVGVLYVLDEPSVGLHARDNARLITALRRLADIGNSVLVVEHDKETIAAADWLIDMGPKAGVHGGEIVAVGTPADVARDPRSVTGPYLSGQKRLELPRRRKPTKKVLRVSGARAHNLRDVTVEVPLGLFTCVTGVSGSGKSSLVVDTLLPALRASLYGAGAPIGDCDRVEGLSHVDKVVSIDQAPIGRTPRSNPATYTGMFTLLRELFAGLPEARARGYKASRFSFNVKGGRCEACQGDGVAKVEMHFLPDVFVKCEACQGRRYGRETLEVMYRGLSISDVLELTVERAAELFQSVPKLRDKLEALARVGLGYLVLGQAATTLSGGEAQRVKLARELAKRATGRTVYVLDEPTTGLHFSDIEELVRALSELCDQGNTVLVIEHNLDVVAVSDWVIDVGPEGGDRGGEIVAVGTPEDITKVARSHTGRALRDVLATAKKSR